MGRTPSISLTAALVVALVTAVAPQAARGDASADEADLRFHRGSALYRDGRYDEALLEFLASNRLVPNRNVVYNIARSYEALERFEEAYRYYAEYIAAESDPRERREAERRLRQIAPRVALIRIESTPPGATVYLEREDLGGRGETPLLIAVPPGTHRVLLRKLGFEDVTAEVRAVRGQESPVKAALQQIVGSLRVEATPPAAVYVDRVAGTETRPAALRTPAVLRLAPGRHTLELEADGYRTQRTDVVVRADAASSVEIALEEKPPPSGTLVLASSTPGALVLVDGEVRGFTPAVLSVPVGRHEVEVRGEGYRPWRRTVMVELDGRSIHEVELEAADQEVTGATRSMQTLATAPASVTLISRREIWAFGYQRLTEAVRAVRGLYASDDLSYEAIGIRGFSRPGDFTNRVLVLRDGHPMNDRWVGSAAVGRDFAADLDDVSRIEVVRGPGSTFYGPGAFFGVIQVVTEEPGVAPQARAGGSLDTRGGGSVFARGTAGDDTAAASVYASIYDSDGQTLRFREFDGAPGGGEVVDADGEDAQRGGFRGRLGELELDAAFSRRRKDIPTAPYGTVVDPAQNPGTDRQVTRSVDRRGYLEGRWTHRRGPLGIAARAAYDHQSYDGLFPYDDGAEAFVFSDAGRSNWLTGELRVSLEGAWHRFTLGGELAEHRVVQSYDDQDDGTDEFRDEHPFTNASLYAVEQISLGDRVLVSAGVRADRFGEQKDTAISPRLATVIRSYPGGYTKLVVGRAFRSPSVYELYYNDGGITQVAPDSLDPEIIWTGEIEHTHSLSPRSFVLGNVFANGITGLIDLGSTMDGILVYQNSSDRIRTVGAEVEARLTGARGAWLGAALSYAHLSGDDPASEVNSAAAVGTLRGYWPVLGERLGLATELVYNGARPRRDGRDATPAVLGRLFASGRLRSERLLYRLGVTNLLDWDWSVPVGREYAQQAIPQQPRTFHVQLVYQID